MKEDKIINGKIYSDNGYGTTYIFEIVDKIPAGYSVWNIPPIANGEYIPVCVTTEPENKNCFDVNITNLKAVKLEKKEVVALHVAASGGDGTIKEIKRTLSRSAKTAYMERRQERARKALPILERITA